MSVRNTIAGVLDALGIQMGILVAGFAGGIVQLGTVKDMTRMQAVLAVFTSLATATYLTPIVASWIGVTEQRALYGLAFGLGVCAMNLIPTMKLMAAKWLDNKFPSNAAPSNPQGTGDGKP